MEKQKIIFYKVFSAVFVVTLFAVLGSPARAYGAAPSVTAFTASPQSVSYGHSTLLSWTIADGTGSDLYFTCPLYGVTIKKDNGTTFPCNTKAQASANVSDSVGFFITNYTGNPVNIPVRIVPRDSSGTSYDGAAITISLSVDTVPHPITDFTTAAPVVTTNTTTATVTWVGVEVQGSNLQFDCHDEIKIYSQSPEVSTEIKCGQPAYVADLATSGSATLYFVNSSSSSIDEAIRILPAISAGVYDATHSRSVTITVAAKAAPVISSISNFSSSATSVLSGQSVNFSWSTTNAQGVNLQIPCGNQIAWANISGTTTSPLLCGVPGFLSALAGTGTTTISFSNGGLSGQSVPVALYLQNPDGTYDATKARIINIIVHEPGYADQSASTSAVTTNTGTAATSVGTTAQTGSGTAVIHGILITSSMRLGSRGAQVSALQTLLKQDPTLYPGGQVTGYLGPASLSALKRFQVRYGLAKQGDSGYGTVGPKTRAKLNSIQTF